MSFFGWENLITHSRDTMIIECPECGAKNQTTQPPQSGKKYRCGKCGATITFLQSTDTQDTVAEIPKEKTQAEKQAEAKKEQDEKAKKRIRLGCGAIVVIAVIGLIIGLLAPSDKTEESALTSSEQAYATTMANHALRVADAMDNLSELMLDAQIGNDAWTIQVAAQLVTIQMLNDEVLEIEPPGSMTHIHNKYVQAMKHFETATQLLPQGIDRLDADLIYQATTEIETGGQLMDETTSLLEIFVEERSK